MVGLIEPLVAAAAVPAALAGWTALRARASHGPIRPRGSSSRPWPGPFTSLTMGEGVVPSSSSMAPAARAGLAPALEDRQATLGRTLFVRPAGARPQRASSRASGGPPRSSGRRHHRRPRSRRIGRAVLVAHSWAGAARLPYCSRSWRARRRSLLLALRPIPGQGACTGTTGWRRAPCLVRSSMDPGLPVGEAWMRTEHHRGLRAAVRRGPLCGGGGHPARAET